MKTQTLIKLGAATLGIAGASIAINSFLPQRLDTTRLVPPANQFPPQKKTLPVVEINFLRCGSATIPECLAVRGSFSVAPRLLVHSAVLIRHPQATFLFDSGLCTNIDHFLLDQSFIFQKTLGNFVLEQPLKQHLRHYNITTQEIDFILLSHLHWDHVAGIPDLPDVPLKVHRIEYEEARQGLFDQGRGLVRRLMGRNPIELFDLTGPAYMGFRNSYDLFGDGSLILVPLPGHTRGQIGLFVHSAADQSYFLIADAAWLADNYLNPAPLHPIFWSLITQDDATARQTLIDLYLFGQSHPEIPMIAMHDGRMQENLRKVQNGRQTSFVQPT